MPYHTLPSIVFGTALVAAMLLLATALGRRVLRLARMRLDGQGERFVFSAGLGIGLLPFVPFALLAARLSFGVTPPNLRTALCVAMGRTSYAAYLERAIDDYRVVEYANRTLPPSAHVLVGTWEEHTAYYRPLAMRAGCWVQDSVHYDSAARLWAELARLPVNYLKLKPMNMGSCPRSLVCVGRMEHETAALTEFARASGTPVYAANGASLVRLNGGR